VMGNRLIFLYHLSPVITDGGTQKGRSAGCWISRFKRVGGCGRQIRRANSET
jgi:hypothetical protein